MGEIVKVKTKEDLAAVLLMLTYGDLMEVARELVGMNKNDPEINRHPETPAGLAETLHDWAEAQ